jgi:hypothetical protein
MHQDSSPVLLLLKRGLQGLGVEISDLDESRLQGRFDKSLGTSTTGTLMYQCAQDGQNISYLASFWKARTMEEVQPQQPGPISSQGSPRLRIEEMLAAKLARGG